MGVPQFFRFVQRKYPKIIHGVEHVDNLYLDMNGIIHPCTHPENAAQPKTEEEMFINIFEYIDHIIELTRPSFIFMAIDGPAPSAKQAQQRSRRFRSALENPPGAWDSNQITPGTPFMFNLTNALKMYVHSRLNDHPLWTQTVVMISDASVAGEGEHKICNFIRSLRLDSSYNPNTKHCVLGLDADLIMLGIATHEPNFYVMREDVLLLERLKRQAVDSGADKIDLGKFNNHPPYIFLSIPILREYLEIELDPNHSQWQLERALDDWVFLCFFVGNDFLPHLPSLEIREGALNLLVDLYKRHFKDTLHLTLNGKVLLDKVEILVTHLGKAEDEIFVKRKQQEDDREQRNQRQQQEQKDRAIEKQVIANNPGGISVEGGFNPLDHLVPVDQITDAVMTESTHKVLENRGQLRTANIDAAMALKMEIQAKKAVKHKLEIDEDHTNKKIKLDEDIVEEAPVDHVEFHKEGWRQRYYASKFKIDILKDFEKHQAITLNYIEGLCWVFEYYYLGCPSWQYVYRYHYAPFASDFNKIGDLKIDFNIGRPYRPLEQLMRVLPPASIEFIPKPWHALMTDEKSEIIDYYPLEFAIDLNGKKNSWQGVVLLPFVDDDRMSNALEKVINLLDTRDSILNQFGNDLLFVSDKHKAYNQICHLYGTKSNKMIDWDSGLKSYGIISATEFEGTPGSMVTYPDMLGDLGVVEDTGTIGMVFEMMTSSLIPFGLLNGAKLPNRELGSWDVDKIKNPRDTRNSGHILNNSRQQGNGNGRYNNHDNRQGNRYNNNNNNNNRYNNSNSNRPASNYSIFNK